MLSGHSASNVSQEVRVAPNFLAVADQEMRVWIDAWTPGQFGFPLMIVLEVNLFTMSPFTGSC